MACRTVGVKPTASRLERLGADAHLIERKRFAGCALFDKWIIERETWAAEFLRLLGNQGHRTETSAVHVFKEYAARSSRDAQGSVVPRQNVVTLPVKSSVLQPESLILAQNERWRQA